MQLVTAYHFPSVRSCCLLRAKRTALLMDKQLIRVVSCIAFLGAVAGAPAVGEHAPGMPSLEQALNDPRLSPTPGFVPRKAVYKSITEVPAGQREMLEQRLRAHRAGYRLVEDREIADALSHALDFIVPPGSNAPTLVGGSSVRLEASELKDWECLGTIPGLVVDGKMITMTRLFVRPDKVMAYLDEMNFADSLESAVLIFTEFLNANVGPHPASLEIEKSPAGLSRSTLSWANERSSYELVVFDDVDHPKQPRWDRDWLLGLAASLGT